jgi:DNA repair exonuclease SbcCD ATPase subunit
MGRNLTEDSQDSNGSGKSAFQSAIEFTYTGTVSRKITKSKIVRRGCKEAVIAHEAFNTTKQEYLRIERVIPFKGSETISIYLFKDRNNADFEKGKVSIATTNDANKWIEKYVGIDKSDLSNYFFPNELTYTSFFNLSDTKAKELISRFSNADIVDSVFSEVKLKSDSKANEIVQKERELLKIEGSLEKSQSDLEKELEKDFEAEKNEEIEKRLNLIQGCHNKMYDNRHKIDEISHSLSHFNNNIIEGRKASLNVFKQYLEQYRASSKDFEGEYKKINEEIEKIQQSIDKSDKLKRDVRSDISSVEVDINKMKVVLSGKISCPKCSHEFNPNSNITVEEATDKLLEFNRELDAFKTDLSSIEALQKKYEENKLTVKGKTKDIDEEQRKFERRDKKIWKVIKLISTSIDNFTSKIDSYNRQLSELDKDNKFQKEMIQKYEEQIESIKKSEKDDKREKEIIEDIKGFQKQIEVLSKEIEVLVQEQESINEWNVNFKLFKSYLANKKLRVIQDMINKYLQEMKCDYRLKLEGFKTLANGETREKITPYIFKDGEICDYGEFSKGERARIDFATLLTLQTLVNDSCETGGLQMLFADEVGEGIDASGLKSILNSFKNTKKTIYITTHVVNENVHENVLIVEKVNGISRIVK